LPEYDFDQFDINDAATACIVRDGKYTFALSKWVSPKRTRTYPFGRVYNTLSHSKKVTVIPVVKDEGKRGDRDYVQWDTVSLMALLKKCRSSIESTCVSAFVANFYAKSCTKF
jgi:hypothetical protein